MKKLYFIIALFVALLNSCIEQPQDTSFFQENELTITAYLEEHSDDYSMLLELLERANYKSAFNAYGTYTMFVYKNPVFTEYLQGLGLSKVSDLSVDEAKTLIRYHSLSSEITSSSLGYGKLPVKNLEDDELVSSFDSTGLQGIIINRVAKVVSRDIQLSNGILQVIDKTLPPITNSVVQEMEAKGRYSIFIEAAKETGFYDILNKKYDTAANGDVSRRYFTLLVEPDVVYQAEGITSIDGLKQAYYNGYDDHTNPEDSLNKFIANHVIPLKALFTKDFETSNYQSYYAELINFIVDRDFRINQTGVAPNERFITFYGDNVNFQAKNGVFHSLDSIMNIFYPEPVEVIWQFNSQPELIDLGRVNDQNGIEFTDLTQFQYMSGSITTMFVHLPWADYGFLLARTTPLYQNQFGDCLVFTGKWDVTVKMPIKIVKGKYNLYIAAKGAPSGRGTVQFIVNDIPVGEPVDLNGNHGYYNQELLVGQINLTETTYNVIEIATTEDGQGQLDYLKFEPL